MAKSHGFTVEQKTEMKVAYEQGTILKVLAEKWQVSVPTMSKYIKSVGGTLRNPGTPKKVKTAHEELGFAPPQLTIDPTPGPEFEIVTATAVPSETKTIVPEIETPQAPVARRILPFE